MSERQPRQNPDETLANIDKALIENADELASLEKARVEREEGERAAEELRRFSQGQQKRQRDGR